ncbi:Glycine dehydrogenase (decarboxylating) [Alkaliphilus metalliredigens QYMF]|uniref:Probable glycine dehydrogenase (decarboxylating) subunit 1 n=1 Tax=Alkaliphilus metalliredigens (strain QYMF) TaxID=293826 RepID=A6TJ90_ALKMQ|nr:aminomethyl-transferring glycine dehydrogenase subunit GcvPA [Alkaliphilus metalliredigens]ABR46258.1 Glycine dehydrogenase (decarboxylating) [Alkaliphilus metalliredigens QYMF]
MFPYIPATEESKKKMLEDVGLNSVEDLFKDISHKVRLKGELNIPKHKSELEVSSYIKKLGKMNETTEDYTCFLGCGAYDHYIPSVVDAVISRSEYYTAYTPYQAEIAQGTLQTIFEFQSMMAGLTGMDVCNASVYDGSTAVYEAAYVAVASNRRKEVLISKSVHPEYRKVLKASLGAANIKYIEIEIKEGTTDLDDLKEKLTKDVSAVIVQSPNFFGLIEEVEEVVKESHENKSLVVMSTDPISLGLLKTPGEMGVDIAIGEAQALGIPLSFGGPYLGFITTTKALLRKVPGRLVGMTKDVDGKRGFVLTLQTREQHIRREKSISNICTNQALNATAATVYLSLMGKEGMKEVAKQNYDKAHYAHEQLISTGMFEDSWEKPFFKEFTLKYKGNLKALKEKLEENKILGGFHPKEDYQALENHLIIAVTEKRSKEEVDQLCTIVKEVE